MELVVAAWLLSPIVSEVFAIIQIYRWKGHGGFLAFRRTLAILPSVYGGIAV
jgi:hypothetical protein